MVKPSPALVAAKREAAQKKQSQSKKLENIFIRDIYQSAIEAKNMIRGATGLTYDRSMAEHYCLWDKNHPECPERFTRVLERCRELGLIERCQFISPMVAKQEEILLKHTQSQIDMLRATEGCEDNEALEKIASRYDAIYIHPSTYKLSLLATGSTINLFEKICRGNVQNGMAVIRPPGHHAMKSEYCGYCFFNNVAIGAEKMLRSNLAKKILIVDWDVHHGQATQQMFYDDPRVVYFSIHRYENGEFWPNLRESDYHYVGEKDGTGYNFNVPLNKTGMTNGDYLAIFHQILLPMAYEFQPDLVIVSAGFDCALGCPEGEMEVTPGFFPHLLSSLLSLANGKVAVVLEGGYCLDSLSEAAALTLRTLLGDPCPPYQDLEPPCETLKETILNVIYAHRAYWKCFQFQESFSIHSESENREENNNRHLPVVIYKGDETKPDHYETRDCYPVQSETVVRHLKNRLVALKQVTHLGKAPKRVTLVYDERMLKHCDPTDDSHPEKPDRISGIFTKHEEYELLNRCQVIKGREATEEELLLAHSASHVNDMRETCTAKPGELKKKGGKLNSVFLNRDTWNSACVAAGSVLQVVDSVLNGESQSGVAIVRPPGHHADDETACGFCIFNNIAVAAKYATRFHHLKRVLIVDWDIHHGNGTQAILVDDPNVLYISIHRYDNAAFFPNSKEANYTFVGTGAGEGYTVNIPWNRKRMGDAEYIAAFQQIVMPIAYQFNPELVLISAGFDACIGDPLGGYTVSPETYGHLTHWLSGLANGRVVIALEGGYNVNSISYAMTMCTKALLGDPLPALGVYQAPCPSAISTIKNVLKIHKQYWPNLCFQMALPKENILPEAKSFESKNTVLSSPLTETKIAFEEIENEKLEMSMRERQRLETITAEEMAELQKEIEKMTILKTAKECIDPGQKDLGGQNNGSTSGASGSGQQQDQGEASGVTANPSLLDYLSDNIQALVQGEMFAIIPLRDCPHLDTVEEVPVSGINVRDPCQECGSTAENWICLRCYTVHCARNINEHAIMHGQTAEHPLTLSFSDLSVWCYGCEAYIDNPRLFAARNAAHLSKFNHELPWTYNEDSSNARE
ncbi:histone deacetylase 6 isoform X2 [Venturia canescens]|uniref:histone deacetylase 6 isoform X2 n=1 Tax=Venturia canescens TaxID=32260 RepID=UPI001C9C6A59|nr:histone deacetylase 6 isoform X2 [Venturia canescens]